MKSSGYKLYNIFNKLISAFSIKYNIFSAILFKLSSFIYIKNVKDSIFAGKYSIYCVVINFLSQHNI